MSKPLDEQLAALRSARQAAKPKPRPKPAQMSKQQSWQVRQRRPGVEASRKAEREAIALETQRWHNAVDTAVHFFETAGLSTRRTHDGLVVVEDLAFDLPRTRAAPRRALNEWIDEIIQRCFARSLGDSLHTNFPALGAQLTVSSDRSGFSLQRNGKPVARVSATHAQVGDGNRLAGNFLLPGQHWVQLHAALTMATPTQSEPAGRGDPPAPGAPRSADYRLHTTLPQDLGDEIIALALGASARLRTDRALVFGHVTALDFGHGRIEFHPLRRIKDHLQVPFRWDRGVEISGALRLSGGSDNDSLPILIDRSAPAQLIGVVWVSALLGYAELTCATAAEARLPRESTPRPAHRRAADPTVRAATRSKTAGRR
jgi:hypothetical protein